MDSIPRFELSAGRAGVFATPLRPRKKEKRMKTNPKRAIYRGALVAAMAALFASSGLAAGPVSPAMMPVAVRLGVTPASGSIATFMALQGVRPTATQVTGVGPLSAPGPTTVGLPTGVMFDAPLSAAIATDVGYGAQFAKAVLMGDWDGSEDNTADRASAFADFSSSFTNPAQTLTRLRSPSTRWPTGSTRTSTIGGIPSATST